MEYTYFFITLPKSYLGFMKSNFSSGETSDYHFNYVPDMPGKKLSEIFFKSESHTNTWENVIDVFFFISLSTI